jgi:dTDP-4-amino-4,6-dideoxygalactose transaminase
VGGVLERAVFCYRLATAAEQEDRVRRVLATGALDAISRDEVATFEREAAVVVGRAGAVAVSSGSAGLELVLRALAIGPGDRVIVPEYAWVSVGTAVTRVGAAVDVAAVTTDLAPTWDQIAALLTPATRVVILAHMRGMAAPDTPRIAGELGGRGVHLVEDCAQAWGTRTAGDHAGRHGVAAVFSMQTHKLVATGEGGVIVADDPSLLGRIRALSGDTRVPTPRPEWRSNHRLSAIHAAIAIPQLRFLDALTSRLLRLQRAAADTCRASAMVRKVLPRAGQPASSNGSLVGIWFTDPTAADRAARILRNGGVPCHQTTGDHDLHIARSWPAPTPAPLVDLRCYADIPVPLLAEADHAEYLALLAALVARWDQPTPKPAGGGR